MHVYICVCVCMCVHLLHKIVKKYLELPVKTQILRRDFFSWFLSLGCLADLLGSAECLQIYFLCFYFPFSQKSGYLPNPSPIYNAFIRLFDLLVLFIMKGTCYIKYETTIYITIGICSSILWSCENLRWVKSPSQIKQGICQQDSVHLQYYGLQYFSEIVVENMYWN